MKEERVPWGDHRRKEGQRFSDRGCPAGPWGSSVSPTIELQTNVSTPTFCGVPGIQTQVLVFIQSTCYLPTEPSGQPLHGRERLDWRGTWRVGTDVEFHAIVNNPI